MFDALEKAPGAIALLRRLAAYLEKMFSFREHAGRVRDGRRRPQIPTSAVWLAAFTLCSLRFRSFNAFEQELRRPRVFEALLGPRKPSADTLGRVLSLLNVEDLRAFVRHVHQRMWRAKSICRRSGHGQRVIAVDGHELWSSRARCCPDCSTRRLTTAEGEVVEYYHRVVMACWIDVSLPVIIDLEPVMPGEGEVVAARRLMGRLVEGYGRLVDVWAGDALYLEAPFCAQVLASGKHFVVVMKQEARELYQDAARLRELVPPTVVREGDRTTRLWDLPDLQTFSTLRAPVRVVWADYEREVTTVVGGRKRRQTETSTWVWVTDLSTEIVPATTIARWGHHRWDIENRAFNELANLWAMNHCFIHNTVAVTALLLTMAMALAVTALFFERNLKPGARRHLTRAALVGRLREDLVACHGICVWRSPP